MENAAEYLKELTALTMKYGVQLGHSDGMQLGFRGNGILPLEFDGRPGFYTGVGVIYWQVWPTAVNFEDQVRHCMEMTVNGTWLVKTLYYWLVGQRAECNLGNSAKLILAEWTSKHRTDEDVLYALGEILCAT